MRGRLHPSLNALISIIIKMSHTTSLELNPGTKQHAPCCSAWHGIPHVISFPRPASTGKLQPRLEVDWVEGCSSNFMCGLQLSVVIVLLLHTRRRLPLPVPLHASEVVGGNMSWHTICGRRAPQESWVGHHSQVEVGFKILKNNPLLDLFIPTSRQMNTHRTLRF